eukprot:jgi/Mesvir1/27457/Mv07239-RA.1
MDPHQNDCPEVIEEWLENGHAKCIAFNRRGTLLAAGCEDGGVVVWDFDTRGVARRFAGHSSTVTSVCWSKDGSTLLTSSLDTRVISWDVAGGTIRSKLACSQKVQSARLHPKDTNRVLVCFFQGLPVLGHLQDGGMMAIPVDEDGGGGGAGAAGAGAAGAGAGAGQQGRGRGRGQGRGRGGGGGSKGGGGGGGGAKGGVAAASKNGKDRSFPAVFNKAGDLILVGTSRGRVVAVETDTLAIVSVFNIPGSAGIRTLAFSRSGRFLLTNSFDRVIRYFECQTLATARHAAANRAALLPAPPTTPGQLAHTPGAPPSQPPPAGPDSIPLPSAATGTVPVTPSGEPGPTVALLARSPSVGASEGTPLPGASSASTPLAQDALGMTDGMEAVGAAVSASALASVDDGPPDEVMAAAVGAGDVLSSSTRGTGGPSGMQVGSANATGQQRSEHGQQQQPQQEQQHVPQGPMLEILQSLSRREGEYRRFEFQDAVEHKMWKAAGFSGDSDFIFAGQADKPSHVIYIWSRVFGQLVKMLEGPQEGLVDLAWHPTRPILASVGKSGLIYIWAKSYTENWSAFAPDFKEMEENEEYVEREDEFDIVDEDDKVKKTRRTDADDNEEVDIETLEHVPAFSDSDDSQGGLLFLPPVVEKDPDIELQVVSPPRRPRASLDPDHKKGGNDKKPHQKGASPPPHHPPPCKGGGNSPDTKVQARGKKVDRAPGGAAGAHAGGGGKGGAKGGPFPDSKFMRPDLHGIKQEPIEGPPSSAKPARGSGTRKRDMSEITAAAAPEKDLPGEGTATPGAAAATPSAVFAGGSPAELASAAEASPESGADRPGRPPGRVRKPSALLEASRESASPPRPRSRSGSRPRVVKRESRAGGEEREGGSAVAAGVGGMPANQFGAAYGWIEGLIGGDNDGHLYEVAAEMFKQFDIDHPRKHCLDQVRSTTRTVLASLYLIIDDSLANVGLPGLKFENNLLVRVLIKLPGVSKRASPDFSERRFRTSISRLRSARSSVQRLVCQRIGMWRQRRRTTPAIILVHAKPIKIIGACSLHATLRFVASEPSLASCADCQVSRHILPLDVRRLYSAILGEAICLIGSFHVVSVVLVFMIAAVPIYMQEITSRVPPGGSEAQGWDDGSFDYARLLSPEAEPRSASDDASPPTAMSKKRETQRRTAAYARSCKQKKHDAKVAAKAAAAAAGQFVTGPADAQLPVLRNGATNYNNLPSEDPLIFGPGIAGHALFYPAYAKASSYEMPGFYTFLQPSDQLVETRSQDSGRNKASNTSRVGDDPDGARLQPDTPVPKKRRTANASAPHGAAITSATPTSSVRSGPSDAEPALGPPSKKASTQHTPSKFASPQLRGHAPAPSSTPTPARPSPSPQLALPPTPQQATQGRRHANNVIASQGNNASSSVPGVDGPYPQCQLATRGSDASEGDAMQLDQAKSLARMQPFGQAQTLGGDQAPDNARNGTVTDHQGPSRTMGGSDAETSTRDEAKFSTRDEAQADAAAPAGMKVDMGPADMVCEIVIELNRAILPKGSAPMDISWPAGGSLAAHGTGHSTAHTVVEDATTVPIDAVANMVHSMAPHDAGDTMADNTADIYLAHAGAAGNVAVVNPAHGMTDDTGDSDPAHDTAQVSQVADEGSVEATPKRPPRRDPPAVSSREVLDCDPGAAATNNTVTSSLSGGSEGEQGGGCCSDRDSASPAYDRRHQLRLGHRTGMHYAGQNDPGQYLGHRDGPYVSRNNVLYENNQQYESDGNNGDDVVDRDGGQGVMEEGGVAGDSALSRLVPCPVTSQAAPSSCGGGMVRCGVLPDTAARPHSPPLVRRPSTDRPAPRATSCLRPQGPQDKNEGHQVNSVGGNPVRNEVINPVRSGGGSQVKNEVNPAVRNEANQVKGGGIHANNDTTTAKGWAAQAKGGAAQAKSGTAQAKSRGKQGKTASGQVTSGGAAVKGGMKPPPGPPTHMGGAPPSVHEVTSAGGNAARVAGCPQGATPGRQGVGANGKASSGGSKALAFGKSSAGPKAPSRPAVAMQQKEGGAPTSHAVSRMGGTVGSVGAPVGPAAKAAPVDGSAVGSSAVGGSAGGSGAVGGGGIAAVGASAPASKGKAPSSVPGGPAAGKPLAGLENPLMSAGGIMNAGSIPTFRGVVGGGHKNKAANVANNIGLASPPCLAGMVNPCPAGDRSAAGGGGMTTAGMRAEGWQHWGGNTGMPGSGAVMDDRRDDRSRPPANNNDGGSDAVPNHGSNQPSFVPSEISLGKPEQQSAGNAAPSGEGSTQASTKLPSSSAAEIPQHKANLATAGTPPDKAGNPQTSSAVAPHSKAAVNSAAADLAPTWLFDSWDAADKDSQWTRAWVPSPGSPREQISASLGQFGGDSGEFFNDLGADLGADLHGCGDDLISDDDLRSALCLPPACSPTWKVPGGPSGESAVNNELAKRETTALAPDTPGCGIPRCDARLNSYCDARWNGYAPSNAGSLKTETTGMALPGSAFPSPAATPRGRDGHLAPCQFGQGLGNVGSSRSEAFALPGVAGTPNMQGGASGGGAVNSKPNATLPAGSCASMPASSFHHGPAGAVGTMGAGMVAGKWNQTGASVLPVCAGGLIEAGQSGGAACPPSWGSLSPGEVSSGLGGLMGEISLMELGAADLQAASPLGESPAILARVHDDGFHRPSRISFSLDGLPVSGEMDPLSNSQRSTRTDGGFITHEMLGLAAEQSSCGDGSGENPTPTKLQVRYGSGEKHVAMCGTAEAPGSKAFPEPELMSMFDFDNFNFCQDSIA